MPNSSPREENRQMMNVRRNIRHLIGVDMSLVALAIAAPASAQNKVDLDDMNIKGELLNDNRLRLSNRDRHRINDRVVYRTDFRREITDGIDVTWPEEDPGRAPACDEGVGK